MVAWSEKKEAQSDERTAAQDEQDNNPNNESVGRAGKGIVGADALSVGISRDLVSIGTSNTGVWHDTLLAVSNAYNALLVLQGESRRAL